MPMGGVPVGCRGKDPPANFDKWPLDEREKIRQTDWLYTLMS